ncbi:MAG: hypothetical protein ACK5VI_04800 [Opitutia bacterium]
MKKGPDDQDGRDEPPMTRGCLLLAIAIVAASWGVVALLITPVLP